VKEAFTKKLTDEIYELIEKTKNINCDVLNIERRLYKYHQNHYPAFKDNYLSVIVPRVSVLISGQK
jgi:hypothetical protein